MFLKRVFPLKDLFVEPATEFRSEEQGIVIEPFAGEREQAEGEVV